MHNSGQTQYEGGRRIRRTSTSEADIYELSISPEEGYAFEEESSEVYPQLEEKPKNILKITGITILLIEAVFYGIISHPEIYLGIFLTPAVVAAAMKKTVKNPITELCLFFSLIGISAVVIFPIFWSLWGTVYSVTCFFWIYDSAVDVGIFDAFLALAAGVSAFGLAMLDKFYAYMGNEIGLFLGVQILMLLFVMGSSGIFSYFAWILFIRKKTREGEIDWSFLDGRVRFNFNPDILNSTGPIRARTFLGAKKKTIWTLLAVSAVTGMALFISFTSRHETLAFFPYFSERTQV
ncbi:uncharacterized protein NEMAJ01_0740 [Nematocida major]|uniref:uncharacterized protein n=1 Tax=Nematocida major TaxID=1912982 RepID=UPI0020083153|nr:uncharacterized protein NEMAJ01_0740 [Nematocida major]KAH9385844.1 hypothetical protein NEMAJ01_0740 [Nematocida major]